MMPADVRTINWLEVVAWCGLTLLLLTLLGSALRHVWEDKVRRIVELEEWRKLHEAGETNVLLVIRDLQNESKNHTKILERMEKQFDVMGREIRAMSVMVGNRRHDGMDEDGIPGMEVFG